MLTSNIKQSSHLVRDSLTILASIEPSCANILTHTTITNTIWFALVVVSTWCCLCGVKMSFMHAKYAFYGFCMVFHAQLFNMYTLIRIRNVISFSVSNMWPHAYFLVSARKKTTVILSMDPSYSIRMRTDIIWSTSVVVSASSISDHTIAKLF